MGRNLFIRVSAVTYDEAGLAKDWPDLSDMVWPVTPANVDPTGDKIKRTFGPQTRGVLELASGMLDVITFGSLPEATSTRLAPLGKTLKAHLTGLEEALGNRDVPTASKLTNAIEDTLDAMQDALRGK